MKSRNWILSLSAGLALGACLLTPGTTQAGIIAIDLPGDVVPGTGVVYTSYTTLMPITVPNFTLFNSVTGGGLTATFSANLNARTATSVTAPGGGWGSWSEAPFSERPAGGTIRVGFHQGSVPLTINLSAGVDVFGFELEGNLLAANTFTAEYFNGATSLGSITRSVVGASGARLFAGVEPGGDLIDRIVVSGTDTTGFGTAQYRFHQGGGGPVVPEPASLTLLGLGGLALVGYARRRRQL